jgi:predicted DNA-binding transcriptional regulator AlpA
MSTNPQIVYVRVADVRRRYGGASDMWITRKTRDFGFPAPVFLGGRDRFWRLDELEAWDRAMIERGSTWHGVAAKRSA